MATLQPSEIARVAMAAGLRDRNNLTMAVAIALMESGGDPQAHNGKLPDDSFGLWQINMLGGMGPERRRLLGIPNNEALFDPATNARAMMLVSRQGKSWTPWTVFTTGLYMRRLGEAANGVKIALGEVPPADPNNDPLIPDVIEGPADALASTTAAIGAAGAWMANRKNWLRVVYVGAGGSMLVVALLIASKPAAKAAGKVVGKVAGLGAMLVPGGGAVKVAGGAAKAAKAGGAAKAAGGAAKAAA